MRRARALSDGEAELWARVVQTVTPLQGRARPPVTTECQTPPQTLSEAAGARRAAPPPPARRAAPASILREGAGLDSHWERKLAKAELEPDYTLDLHGHTLDTAHARLDRGLAQARALGARLVLLITGRPRPADAADRASKRGAIRAKVVDWLAAGPHADAIAAIRPAHRRHGGAGALYIVLRRGR